MKNTLFRLSLVFLSLFTLFILSCSDDDDDNNDSNGSIEVVLTPNRVSSTPAAISMKITTAREWNITTSTNSADSWVTFSSNSGVGTSTVIVRVNNNDSVDDRFVDITVSDGKNSKTVRLTQEGKWNPNEPEEDDPYLGWIELPEQKSVQNAMFVSHRLPNKPSVRNYSMLYDTVQKVAYWVAYPMHSSYRGSSGRSDNWAYNPRIPARYQANLFNGISGYDRGHQIPSADRTTSWNDNSSTFYYTNMTPQNSTLNQGIWASLETKVRTWMNQADTLYVVTGASITTKTNQQITYANDNDGKKIAVPKYYYKALLKREGNNYYAVAYKMDNAIPTKNDYNQYRITVKELEEETGFVFFPKIPASVKETIVSNKWN